LLKQSLSSCHNNSLKQRTEFNGMESGVLKICSIFAKVNGITLAGGEDSATQASGLPK